MTESLLAVVEAVLLGAGYRIERPRDRVGVLGEDATRIVWAVSFPGITALLDGWEAEQAWLVNRAAGHVSLDKSWELYLVLTCEPTPDEYEAQAIEGIQRDVSYARKLVVAGAGGSPSRMKDRLAPLHELVLDSTAGALDALSLLEERANAEGNRDAVAVLGANRSNLPLFADL